MSDVVDLRGTRCPLTLLKIQQILYNSTGGEDIIFAFDDPGPARDLPIVARKMHWACEIEPQPEGFTAVCRQSTSFGGHPLWT